MKTKKVLPLLKSILILSLAALAVFQVSRLWLVDFTNRNFFIYLQARFQPAAPDGQSAFARPFRIISGAGDGRFEIRYSGIAGSLEWAFGENVLDAVLRNGVSVARIGLAPALTMEYILSRPVFVYEYAFDMCAETFTQAFGRRIGTLLTDSGIESFSAVAVWPTSGDESFLSAFFISDDDIFQFAVPQDFQFAIRSTHPEGLHFVYAHGGFIPVAPRGGFTYSPIIAENPFRDSRGLFTLPHIRSRVEPFFDNPATIIPGVSGVDNIFTFSNRNTMVRYLENAVLEYTSYRPIGRTAPENFMADFSAALAFVTEDLDIELFLRNHDTRGRAHVFWFDYVIDNRPLVLTREWYTGPRCTDPLLAPVEVVVDHGRVVRYRRLVYTFRTSGSLAWKNAAHFETDEFFELGFPIGSGPIIDLAVLTYAAASPQS